ncbi:aminotransferase class I/II-fold pyridoxal phosphate-dependent enzyme [Patescibacteria group bacterium]|nr:aminotransferase class I/II-fold pyridoxal phosphate-dependent enzyme [Patescibacteria group bacterium]
MSAFLPFTSLSPLELDPIFESAKSAAAAGPNAINGTIGVILDEEGYVLRLRSTKKALNLLHENEPLGYSPLAGVPEFLEAAKKLVLGSAEPIPCIASSGGTGALSVLLRLAHATGIRKVILPTPTWANHQRVITAAGLEIEEVEYLENDQPSFDALSDKLSSLTEPHIILLHACCHNPLGLDPLRKQWQKLSDALKSTEHLPLLDFAYQGLGDGVEEDVYAVRLFKDADIPCMIAWSASKNHGIYGLRTGAALVLAPLEEHVTIQQHLEIISRSIFSVAPVTGQHIVAITQEKFYDEWMQELADVRESLERKREVLAQIVPVLSDRCANAKGIFLTLPITDEQSIELQKQNIFLAPGGRLNIAGIPEGRMGELAEGLKGCVLD